MRIEELSKKLQQVPRNKNGDPAFATEKSLHDIFGPDEIVELVNRALYQLEYQQKAHKKFVTKRNELEQPVKEKFKQLYPHQSWAKASLQQVKEAVQALKEEKDKDTTT